MATVRHDDRRSKRLDAVNAVWRIETPRLLLRCLTQEDATALVEAITCSLESLQRWMEWARSEPRSVAEKQQLIARWRREFAMALHFHYGIFVRANLTLAGVMGMHARIGAGARELGYWVRADQQRTGIASEAAMAVTRIGFEHLRLRRMEIHCDPRNAASSGVARRAGYQFQVEISNLVREQDAPCRNGQLWRMTPAVYAQSSSAGLLVHGFNETGEEVSHGMPG